jgi:dTDP-4-amino-4,6-dideoxygalactose transaminase
MTLALLGGDPTVTRSLPHEIWPPQASAAELEDLARQRQTDIRISGNAGPVGEFEHAFLDFLDRKVAHAVAFNAGTSALLAAYYAVGVRPGDEIIAPDLTYHAAASPAFMLGASVVVADIDAQTRCIDPSTVEALVTERTKAITVVHQWGHPADMDALLKIAQKHGLRVVEDCSHAHGSRYQGRLCGTFGDVAVFSLQANKAVFAGEGGILVTNDSSIQDRAILLGHYRDRARSDVEDAVLSTYWATGAGLKLRMSVFNAIVALHSLKAFPERMAGRHKCLEYLNAGLAGVDYLEPVHIAPDVSMGAWYGFKPLYRQEKLGVSRATLVKALQAEGLEISAPSGDQLSAQPLYQHDHGAVRLYPSKVANSPLRQPVANRVASAALSLPTFYDWESDRPLIDGYLEAVAKIGCYGQELRDWEAETV